MAGEKNRGKGKREWPKYPNPKDGGSAKGWDWTKKQTIPQQRLELALEAIKNSFGNDAGLSGTSVRQLSEDKRKALRAFKESFDAPEAPALRMKQEKECWRAIQMASQEVYLQKNKVKTEEIALQHRWNFAKLPNNTAKLVKIARYLALPKVKVRGYPSDKLVAELLELKKRGGIIRTEKKITLKDLIDSLKAYDLSVINSISRGVFVDMVTSDTNQEYVVDLINIIDKIRQEVTVYFKLISAVTVQKD
jgi:hypothetical protein